MKRLLFLKSSMPDIPRYYIIILHKYIIFLIFTFLIISFIWPFRYVQELLHLSHCNFLNFILFYINILFSLFSVLS